LPPQYKAGPDPQVVQISQQAQQMHQQAQQFLAKADQEIIQLKQENRELKLQLKDKSVSHVIDDYDAETRRLAAVGNIDPHSLQIVVRQLVEDMWQTKLEPMLHAHADIQGQLAARTAPPQPMNGNGVNGGSGPSAGAGNGADGGNGNGGGNGAAAGQMPPAVPPAPAAGAGQTPPPMQ
jgi:uncharacterized membrane protein YgcG